MTFQTVNWGDKTSIRFLPRVLDKEKVEKAAAQVIPSFKNMKDSFVALDQNNGQIVAFVPDPKKAKAQTFTALTQGVSLQEAMRQALEKAANFLKGRA